MIEHRKLTERLENKLKTFNIMELNAMFKEFQAYDKIKNDQFYATLINSEKVSIQAENVLKRKYDLKGYEFNDLVIYINYHGYIQHNDFIKRNYLSDRKNLMEKLEK